MTSVSQPRPSVSTTPSTRTSLDTSASTSAANASPLPSRSSSRAATLVSPSSTGFPSAGLTPTNPTSAGLQPPTSPAASRRNRAALRDYYGLKKTQAEGSSERSDLDADSAQEPRESELDAPGFNAESYVADLLAKEGLDSLLRTESGLVNDVKFLASERAALVYDNYSKLITATDTIKRMRTNMAPLTPATSTLSPAVAHIADTARHLAIKTQGSAGSTREQAVEGKVGADTRIKQRDTVRWVLGTPRRIEELGPDKAEWPKVQELLDAWKGVPGVENVREECKRAVAVAEAKAS